MSKRARLRLWLLDHIPDTLLARPGEWFIAYLGVSAGVSILFGAVDENSAMLPMWLNRAWGVALLIGALSLAVGLSSVRGTMEGKHVITRVPAYRLGLRLLGVAAIVYGLAVASNVTPLAAIPLAAFAAMCGLRLLTLGGR